MLPHILTQSGISIVVPGRAPICVSRDHEHFSQVVQLVKDEAPAEQIDELLNSKANALQKAVSEIESEFPDLKIDPASGVVFFEGVSLGARLTSTILRHLEEGFDLRPYARFVQKLAQNPSKRVWDQLYDFLEAGQIPITENGDFRVYKAIRLDWKDIHSGTMDNSIGAVVQMPRRGVDDDPERTCSHGLHVCSFNYLPHFAHANGRIVQCDVSPADVVAIPRDYNNTKMRVCRYVVVAEYPGYYKGQGDVLAQSSIVSDPDTYPFQVFVNDELSDQFESLSEAAVHFDSVVENSMTYDVVELRNGLTQKVLHESKGTCDDDDDEDYDDEDEDELS